MGRHKILNCMVASSMQTIKEKGVKYNSKASIFIRFMLGVDCVHCMNCMLVSYLLFISFQIGICSNFGVFVLKIRNSIYFNLLITEKGHTQFSTIAGSGAHLHNTTEPIHKPSESSAHHQALLQ
jgi:hypothetical protein